MHPLRDEVFISYSHTDETWRGRVLTYLKPYVRTRMLAIWDDSYVQVGDLWRREIDNALQRAAVGLLLVTQEFIASDFIMEVELPALRGAAEEGSLTLFAIPISSCTYQATGLRDFQWARSPDAPLDLLDEPQRNRVLVEITEKLVSATETRISRQVPVSRPASPRVPGTPLEVPPVGAPGELDGVPALPSHYLPRPDDLARLRDALLASTAGALGITGTLSRLGLHGQGGIGKSVLASALACDEKVRCAFPDGVYWVTLGQEPDLQDVQARLARRLGESAPAVTSVSQGRELLARLLRDRASLLVLDDVWDAAHALAFDVLGPRSRLLVTTRDGTILTALAAREETVERLLEGPAVRLLASWAGQDDGSLPGAAREVAAECGYLPLALAVAGAQVRDGIPWVAMLEALRRGRLEFLDHPYGNVFRSLRPSVDALSPSQRQRYLELAVFAEDVRIPESLIQRLWKRTGGVEAYQASALLAQLGRKALLEVDEADAGREVVLHDLQHDFIRVLVEDVPALNRELLAVMAEGPGAGDDGRTAWHCLAAGEAYPWLHLRRHLLAAGKAEEFEDLLFDTRWLEGKLCAAGISAVLSDFDGFAAGTDPALVAAAIGISQHVLVDAPDQLSSQLIGRLGGIDRPRLRVMLEAAAPLTPRSWLRPLTPSLMGVTSGLRWTRSQRGGTYAVAVTPDGRHAVSGAEDHLIDVWDIESGRKVRSLRGHSDVVLAIALSATGRVLSGSHDGVKVWSLESGRQVRPLTGHHGGVLAVALTADGRHAAAGLRDGTLKLWDADDGRELGTLSGHSAAVWTVALANGGRRAVTGSEDHTLKVWDVERGEALRTFQVSSCVRAVALTADGRLAISGADDGSLQVWDVEGGRELCVLPGHRGRIMSVALTPDGRRAVTGSDDRMLKVWDVKGGREIRTLKGHSGAVISVGLAEDGRRAASSSDDGMVKVWEVDDESELRPLPGHSDAVRAVALTRDARWAVSGSDDRTLKVWDVESGRELRPLAGHTDGVWAVAVTPDGRRAVSGSRDGTLKVWEPGSGECLQTLHNPTGGIRGVAVSADGTLAVSSSDDFKLMQWDLTNGQKRRYMMAFAYGARSRVGWLLGVALTPDGRRAAAGLRDGTVRIWDVQSGRQLKTLQGHTEWVRVVALTPDGRRAVSGSDDHTLNVWDVESGKKLYTLGEHRRAVLALALAVDGRRVVSGSRDGAVKVWELESGREIAAFHADAPVLTCAIGPDQRTVVAGDGIGRLHLLRIVEPAPASQPAPADAG
jgi:WD40 repeat protein